MKTDIPKELIENITKTRNIKKYLEFELKNQTDKLKMLIKTRKELHNLKGGLKNE